MQGCEDVKMGRGSPVCHKPYLKIVKQSQNNVAQIAKRLKIPLSTVHDIIKRFRESARESAPENIWCTIKWKTLEWKAQDCWAARILNQTRMGQHSSPRTPATGLLISQRFNTVVKRVDATQWSTSPCSIFLEMCCTINVKMSKYFPWNGEMSQFQHLICSLDVIKYEFMKFANHWILFLLLFYTASQLYWNWVCI